MDNQQLNNTSNRLLISSAIRIMIASFLIAFVMSFTAAISPEDALDKEIRTSGVVDLSDYRCYLTEVRSENLIVKNYLNEESTRQMVILCEQKDDNMIGVKIYNVMFSNWFRHMTDELKHNSSDFILKRYEPIYQGSIKINNYNK